MSRWTLSPDFAHGETARAFADLERVFALEGTPITAAPMSEVIRIELDGHRYYVKRYTGAGKNPLRRWFARPRVQLEWENLQRFARWGIPTARIAAFGLERKAGRFVRGAMITQEIPATADLATLANKQDPRLANAAWVDAVSRQLAAITRTLHAQRFAHNDLKWRNILVTEGDAPQLFLIDCPAGMHWIEPFLSHRIIKDLATLDKVAQHQLSRSQRLRFYHRYTGRPRLNTADRKRVRKVLRYFEGRE